MLTTAAPRPMPLQDPAALRAAIFGPEVEETQADTSRGDWAYLAVILVGGFSLTALTLTFRAELYFLWLLIEELCS